MQFFISSTILLLTVIGPCSSQPDPKHECTPVINNIYFGDRGSKGVQVESGLDPIETLGTWRNPARTCKDIIQNNSSSQNGIYYILDKENNIFPTYCDMVTARGGWTLVASVHENNIKGKCNSGDRWSSEQGNSPEHPHGDGFWGNRATHGMATSATSDDYKNPAYFNMEARDVMIWKIPNDTPMTNFESEAFLKFHTETGFLTNYEGNLHTLFSKHYKILSKTYRANLDNGPAIPIIWDRGNNETMVEYTTANLRMGTEPGYIQFRAVNYERNVFALCPGVRIKAGEFNIEHACIGSTSNNIGHTNEEKYCGDFAAMDYPGWSVPDLIMKSVLFIFYR